MSERILVAYATRKGSTAEVATVIGQVLRTRGYEVDVLSVTQDPAADDCVAVLIGSAVNGCRKRLAYLDAIRPLVHPVDEAFFLGIGPDPANDSSLARWLFRRFGGAGEGDCRNWAAIRGWASTVLADRLAPDGRQPASEREQVAMRSRG
jgi:hypothetical protein